MSDDLSTLVERYLEERRCLGFQLRYASYSLRSFADYVHRVGHRGPCTSEIMSRWAREDCRRGSEPRIWGQRLRQLRAFARWLQQFEPRTEVPNDTLFGRRPARGTPHIYQDQDVERLLAAARDLGPRHGLRGLAYETVFGLLASTGLRVSEALALRVADVDLVRGVLTVRRTKFGKSRAVPLHATAAVALRHYRVRRDLTGASSAADEPFFIGTRPDRFGKAMRAHEVRRVFAALRCELGWSNRGTHHAPRVHDLRHTFVVQRILRWQQQGVDVDQAMLSLSTYVGHARVADTYWYLQAVPELLAVAAQRFELCMPEVRNV